MLSAITTYMPRWLMAIIATALVLATVVGSSQDSAEAIDPADTDTVYIADGTTFADALMGATIAALNTSPMLGVAGTDSGDTIPGDTVAELDRLTNNKNDLLDTIYVFGGTSAVSSSVFEQLGQWANDVQRIEGDSRWGTYQAISQMLPAAVDEAVHAEEADNADTLDGNDSTDFLGATDQAADSDLFDGMDSGAFVETANDVAQYKRHGGFVDVGNSATTMLSLSVPAGTYIFFAKGLMNNNDSSAETMNCEISGPSVTDEIGDAGGAVLDVNSESDRIPFSLIVPAAFASGGTVDLVCVTSASNANVMDAALTAIPVSTYTAP